MGYLVPTCVFVFEIFVVALFLVKLFLVIGPIVVPHVQNENPLEAL